MIPATLNRAHIRILEALGILHFATSAQLCRLLYAPTSITHVRDKMRDLEAMGYVYRDLKEGKTTGKKEAIFTYTDLERSWLASRGYHKLPSLAKHTQHSGMFQKHVLGITDILIAAYNFESAHPDRVVLDETVHDIILKRRRIPIQTSKGERTYVPDAWLHFTIDGKPYPMLVEYDRGTERDDVSFRLKVETILRFAQGPVAEYFGVTDFTILFVVNPENVRTAPYRARQIRQWAASQLANTHDQEWGQLFLFAPIDPAACDAREFFTAPCWASPFSDDLAPLVEGF